MDQSLLTRIARILPLLGSSNPTDVTHAAQAIVKLLRENGHTLADLGPYLKMPAPQLPAPEAKVVPFPRAMPPERVSSAQGWRAPLPAVPQPRRVKSAWAIDRDDIESVFIRRGELDAWSEEFLTNIHEWVHGGRSLTEKQRDKLNEIMDRLGA